MKKRLLLSMIAACGLCLSLPAAAAELKSQLSGWLSLNDISPITPRLGLRWQPALSLGQALGKGWSLDGELSLDIAAGGAAPGWSDPVFDGEFQLYRLWLRLSSRRFEARLGLQKINFGSATVFRPLMWFDALDPRDPLQITAGARGLLLRYYFKNNANAWLWGLYGNTDAKGWETMPTARRVPEFGGRLQVPFLAGEAAATAHFRRSAAMGDPAGPAVDESRFAFDGKWDLGFGFWIEGAFTHREDPAPRFPAEGTSTHPWQRSLCLGVDYTFALGNGLYLLAEQFFSHGSASPLGTAARGPSFSALLARYPLGLLDSLTAVFYFDWLGKQAYNFASWQRTTDHWQFHVMAFWNPARPLAVQEPSGRNLFAGRGFQLLAVWNI